MPYIMEITKAGRTVMIEKKFSSRYHKKGIKRSPNKGKTSESQEICNTRKAERNLTILMNANFKPGDYHVVIEYEDKTSDPIEAKKDKSRFLRKLRALYKKYGYELRQISTTEYGKKKKALHHHLVINNVGIDTREIQKLWTEGWIRLSPLDDTGEYSKLAVYMIKNRPYWKAAVGTGHQISTSRNLVRPEPDVKIIQCKNGYYEKPRDKKGYYVAPDSERSFTTEAGWPYMRYILVKTQGRRAP